MAREVTKRCCCYCAEALGENNATVSAPLEQLPPARIPQAHPIQHSFTSVTSINSHEGIEPIVEALITTLAGKARTGRLGELKALELLEQAVLL